MFSVKRLRVSDSAAVPFTPFNAIAPVPAFTTSAWLAPVTAPSTWLKLPAAEVIVVSDPNVSAPNAVICPSVSVPLVVAAPNVNGEPAFGV